MRECQSSLRQRGRMRRARVGMCVVCVCVCMCGCAGVRVGGWYGVRRSQAVGPGAQVAGMEVFPSPRGLLYSCSTEPGSCESKG